MDAAKRPHQIMTMYDLLGDPLPWPKPDPEITMYGTPATWAELRAKFGDLQLVYPEVVPPGSTQYFQVTKLEL